ncbi:hypothetical protein J2W14_002852 [Pseudarthrobacter oxydans]|uniref:hypothetical protein n=1 Tax=Pseudarthrobacter oxydans TaxID=1671 RepID=UPI00277F837E|nr:hypothetical protein [Pseudarthrobacter oxydans]MDP9983431.1 hypothetical protein [Pseudarthrobacter oxydans]
MQQNSVSATYVAAELQARDYRAGHDFGEAARSARKAAVIALSDGQIRAWWNMTFLQAECLLAAGEFEASAEVSGTLVASGSTTPQLQAQVHILRAKACQGAGLLDVAAAEARAATELVQDEADIEVNVTAGLALISALGDSGQLHEAWAESLNLANAISAEVDEQLLGKAYWVIGNVAFLCGKVAEGLYYHELAADTFSPTRNLDVWAKFNKASAAMRLAADVSDADTLRCIERAELATDVIGGSANDYLLLKLNRGHWNFLAGDYAAAVDLLEEIFVEAENPSPQILGEAGLLLGRANASMGNRESAQRHLLKAVEHFEASGAQQRADQAREYLSNEA